ncbi:uncharacterized protein LOC122367832 isoform X2 [Amphibalanus amphitrite]|uniref:uncharacterized protein LOC122367832 isoform X2 n=1 Tax=Amphibalanus amphitrite TaxID=1232801 RepID=UPI001C90DB30|nr:uncharacterized protein LOC122367832 isoform X2 [Amphibalanus amphitrite]
MADFWSERAEERLIEAIKEYTWLFDCKHRWYKDKNKKQNSWMELAGLFGDGIGAPEVERHWLLMRDRYRRAKKASMAKVPSGSSRQDAERSRPRWPLFEAMDAFLARHTCQRRRGRGQLLRSTSQSNKRLTRQPTSCLPTGGWLCKSGRAGLRHHHAGGWTDPLRVRRYAWRERPGRTISRAAPSHRAGALTPTEPHSQPQPIGPGEPSRADAAAQRQPSRAAAAQRQPSRADAAAQRQPSRAAAAQRQPSRAAAAQRQPSRAAAAQRQPSRADAAASQPSRAAAAQRQPSRAAAAQRQPSRADAAASQPCRASWAAARTWWHRTPTHFGPPASPPPG